MNCVPGSGSRRSVSSHFATPTVQVNSVSNSRLPSARTPSPGTSLAPRKLKTSPYLSPTAVQVPQALVSRPATVRYYNTRLSPIADLVRGLLSDLLQCMCTVGTLCVCLYPRR